MKKHHESERILERRLAKRVADSALVQAVGANGVVSTTATSGGTFTRSGADNAFDDCADEKVY